MACNLTDDDFRQYGKDFVPSSNPREDVFMRLGGIANRPRDYGRLFDEKRDNMVTISIASLIYKSKK